VIAVPDVGVCAQVACVWEVTARKAGNVHRFRDFEDSTFLDFILSAAAVAPVLARAANAEPGALALACVRATRAVVSTNTNLGIVLLLAPLAAVPEEVNLRAGVEAVLASTNVEDARLVYEAIRLAAPGGLGRAAEQDVAEQPTQTLREVMALAAGRDLVARQYANGFREVFEIGAPAVLEGIEQTESLEGAIVHAQLQLLARQPDTLIARKLGPAEAQEAGARAARVLALGWPGAREGREALAELDGWLRAEGHRRNPGATADLLTAALFVLLREGAIRLPAEVPWEAGFGR
jgi:triphosphoribosyl-dephospho-CoA synthase